jgi:hypothetical protein
LPEYVDGTGSVLSSSPLVSYWSKLLNVKNGLKRGMSTFVVEAGDLATCPIGQRYGK